MRIIIRDMERKGVKYGLFILFSLSLLRLDWHLET